MAGGGGAEPAGKVRPLKTFFKTFSISLFFSSRLSSSFGIRGIPALIVVDTTDGAVITKDGRSDVMRSGAAAFAQWQEVTKGASDEDTEIVEQLRDNPPDVRESLFNCV